MNGFPLALFVVVIVIAPSFLLRVVVVLVNDVKAAPSFDDSVPLFAVDVLFTILLVLAAPKADKKLAIPSS